MGLLWDAFRESTSSPKDKIIAAVSAFAIAAILVGVGLWAFEGAEHFSEDLGQYVRRRSRSRVLDGLAIMSGVGAVVLTVFGVLLLVIPARRPEG